MRPPAVPAALRLVDALDGARLALPLALGSFAYGLVFGALAAAQKFSLAQATAFSAAAFAGAAQFVVLDVWTEPLPVAAVTLTALAVNVRFLLYGAVLAPTLGSLPAPSRYGAAFFLTDESFSLAAAEQRQGQRRAALVVGAGAALWVAWVGGSVAGHLAGGQVPDPAAWGLDFVFVAVFVSLLASLQPGRREVLPWAVAALVALVVERLVPGAWYVVAGAFAGSLTGAATTPKDSER